MFLCNPKQALLLVFMHSYIEPSVIRNNWYKFEARSGHNVHGEVQMHQFFFVRLSHLRRSGLLVPHLQSDLESRSTVPRQLFFYGEIAGFETSSRPCLLKQRCPLPPGRHRSIVL